jgi:hypothetical protein
MRQIVALAESIENRTSSVRVGSLLNHNADTNESSVEIDGDIDRKRETQLVVGSSHSAAEGMLGHPTLELCRSCDVLAPELTRRRVKMKSECEVANA